MRYSFKNSIDYKIDINSKYKEKTLQLSEEDIRKILNIEKYIVKYINFQNNSINGVMQRNKKRYFFKILKEEEFSCEITGYMKVKNAIPVNNIVEVCEFKNAFIIIYEYEETIGKNEGLLNDFLVKNDIKIEDDSKKIIKNIIDIYKRNFKVRVSRENYPMKQFFDDRINSRLIDWYSKENLFDYKVVVNEMESITTNKIIEETIKTINLKNELECAISQGDPNTLNIGTKPIFFDFSTAGYNPIICEFSVILWSVLIADAYYCPKYHPESYYNHEKIFENVEKFMPNLKYEINNTDKTIKMQSNIKTSKIRSIFINEYINMLKSLNIKIGKEIIFFLVMRILCVFDIRRMEEKDYFYSIFILHYLYQNISEDIYDSLKCIINNFEEII